MELLQRHLVSTVVVLQIRSTERNNAIRSESQKRITRLFCFLDNIVFLYIDKEIEYDDNESFFHCFIWFMIKILHETKQT